MTLIRRTQGTRRQRFLLSRKLIPSYGRGSNFKNAQEAEKVTVQGSLLISLYHCAFPLSQWKGFCVLVNFASSCQSRTGRTWPHMGLVTIPRRTLPVTEQGDMWGGVYGWERDTVQMSVIQFHNYPPSPTILLFGTYLCNYLRLLSAKCDKSFYILCWNKRSHMY